MAARGTPTESDLRALLEDARAMAELVRGDCEGPCNREDHEAARAFLAACRKEGL